MLPITVNSSWNISKFNIGRWNDFCEIPSEFVDVKVTLCVFFIQFKCWKLIYNFLPKQLDNNALG